MFNKFPDTWTRVENMECIFEGIRGVWKCGDTLSRVLDKSPHSKHELSRK